MAEQLANLQKNEIDKYSTTEQVVGTWIDGKPIYQITITGNTPSSGGTYPTSSTVHAYSIGANVEKVISIFGSCASSTGASLALNAPTSSTQYIMAWVRTNGYSADPNKVVICCGSTLTNCPFSVTIQYTKV